MATLATTRMSSKGQIVIPEDIRNRLGLKAGIQFVVVGEDDVVILKILTAPSIKDFDGIIRKARRKARITGLRQTNIAKAVSRTRAQERKSFR
jgi:AbrB family looped-hinge helix DNA binding protein